MKKAVWLLVMILILSALFGCQPAKEPTKKADAPKESSTGNASGDDFDVQTLDYGWIRLEAPGSFMGERDPDYLVTLKNTANAKQYVTIEYADLQDGTIDAVAAVQTSAEPGKYSIGPEGFFSNIQWTVLNYQENGLESRLYFALAGDGVHYIRLNAVGLMEEDFEFAVILGNIVLNPGEM